MITTDEKLVKLCQNTVNNQNWCYDVKNGHCQGKVCGLAIHDFIICQFFSFFPFLKTVLNLDNISR